MIVSSALTPSVAGRPSGNKKEGGGGTTEKRWSDSREIRETT